MFCFYAWGLRWSLRDSSNSQFEEASTSTTSTSLLLLLLLLVVVVEEEEDVDTYSNSVYSSWTMDRLRLIVFVF